MISKLKLNKAWPGLEALPAQDDEAIVREYARLVSEIDGVRGVWAQMEGRNLAVLTLVDDDRSVQRQVHKAELGIYDRWPGALVEFRVYRDLESLLERVQDTPAILIEA